MVGGRMHQVPLDRDLDGRVLVPRDEEVHGGAELHLSEAGDWVGVRMVII